MGPTDTPFLFPSTYLQLQASSIFDCDVHAISHSMPLVYILAYLQLLLAIIIFIHFLISVYG